MTLLDRYEIGDNRAILRTLPESTFSCCVTSPPYWGLRDYGTRTWFAGDPSCSHAETTEHGPRHPGQVEQTKWKDADAAGAGQTATTRSCVACGAWFGQLGLEPTPEAYVANMVDVFREVRRVLADDGTLWLNLGDSYAGSRSGEQGASGEMATRSVASQRCRVRVATRTADGLKPKDLVGIPWRVAFALQADGWYLRSDIIWAKKNPMPESVRDRPTKAHEYVFLLSKSEKYFYAADEIAETATGRAPGNKTHRGEEAYASGDEHHRTKSGLTKVGAKETRNTRSVWHISNEPFDDAHFAVMPTALVQRCVLAGSPAGGSVLDPFLGSGTVAEVAARFGRRWFGCEINPAYESMIRRRTAQTGLALGLP